MTPEREPDKPSQSHHLSETFIQSSDANSQDETLDGSKVAEEANSSNSDPQQSAGQQIGDYQLVREVGRGGMGIVYEAAEVSLDRRVALKVLPSNSWKDRSREQRFLNESRAAAQLNHEHIVPIYSVGKHENVRYFVMRFIDGRNLNQVVKGIKAELSSRVSPSAPTPAAVKLSTVPDAQPNRKTSGTSDRLSIQSADRIDLTARDFERSRTRRRFSVTSKLARTVACIGATVADALHHAHEAGVIHRDIKPSNLLLDNDGKVWVTDFGLAQVKDAPSITQTGVLLGTLRYMSPEQAAGRRSFVDHRTDIYSLGATLYELLTLEPLVKEEGTEAILKKVALGAPTSIRRIDSAIPDDLAVILEKALSKDPADRYVTADELAIDLRHFINNEPIRAKRPGVIKRCRHWLGRHRLIASTLLIGIACLFFTSVVTAGLVWNALLFEKQQREKTETVLTESEGLRMLANANLQLEDNPGLALALAIEGSKGAPGLEANMTLQAAIDANHEYATIRLQDTYRSQVSISPDGEKVVACASARINKSEGVPAIVHDMRDGSKLYELDSGDIVTSASFSPSGRYILTTSVASGADKGEQKQQRATLWDANTGDRLQLPANVTLPEAHALLFHPDNTKAALVQDNNIVLVTLANSSVDVVFRGHASPVKHIEFSVDGQLLLSVSEDKTVRIWNTEKGKETRAPIHLKDEAHKVQAAFNADSKSILILDDDLIKTYAVDSEEVLSSVLVGKSRFSVSRSQMRVLVFGRSAATFRDSNSLRTIHEFISPFTIKDAEFHPQRPFVLFTSGKYLFVYDCWSGTEICRLGGHDLPVTHASLNASANQVASVSIDRTLRLWRVESGLSQRTFKTEFIDRSSSTKSVIALSHNSSHLAIGSHSVRQNTFRDSNGTSVVGDLRGMPCQGLCSSQRFLTIRGNTIVLSERSTGRELYRDIFADRPMSASLSGNGRYVIVHVERDRTFLVDTESETRTELGFDKESITDVRFSPDSTIVCAGTRSGEFFTVDTSTGVRIWTTTTNDPVANIDISPDSSRAVVLGAGGTVTVFNLRNQKPATESLTFNSPMERIRFLDNGKLFVVWNPATKSSVSCYNTETLEPIGAIPSERFTSVSVRPNSAIVAIVPGDSLLLWNPRQDTTTVLADSRCVSMCLAEDKIAAMFQGQDGESPTLKIFSCETGQPEFTAHLSLEPRRIAYDAKAKLFVLTEIGYSSHLFDFESGNHLVTSPPHPRRILWSGFSRQHNLLVTASSDGTIRTCDSNGQSIGSDRIEGFEITKVDIDPEGTLLLLGSTDGRLALWSVSERKLSTFLNSHAAEIHTIQFAKSGSHALTSSSDGKVRLWDLRTKTFVENEFNSLIAAELSATATHSLAITNDLVNKHRQIWLVDYVNNTQSKVSPEAGAASAHFTNDAKSLGLLHTKW